MKKYRKELTPVVYSQAALKLIHFDILPNKNCFPTHWHDRMEFLRIRRGEMFCGYDSHMNKLCADEVMIISPHMPHRGYTTDQGVSYDVLMFDVRSFYNESKVCQTYLPAIYDGRAKLQHISAKPEIIECLDTIRDIANDEPDSLEITSYVYKLFYLLYKHCLVDLKRAGNANNDAMEFSAYIQKNYAEELNTEMLSKHFGYTAAHFCRKFKDATGLTPMTYLKIYRLEKAHRLIKEGSQNINNIAQHCGFSDQNYFTRCFKEHFGMPPSYFIKQKRLEGVAQDEMG